MLEGTCNCQSNYVGQSCDISYRDLVCPNNCSFEKGQGNCDLQNGFNVFKKIFKFFV